MPTLAYLNAIKAFEGFSSKGSWDYAQFTNGFGTKAKYAGETIDKAEADRRFSAEIDEAGRLVDHFSSGLDEGTRAALTSLTFNAGTAWMKSGLGQAVASRDLARAKELLLNYNTAGGQVLNGLSQRRMAEAAWIGASSEPSGSPRCQGSAQGTGMENLAIPAAAPAGGIVQQALAQDVSAFIGQPFSATSSSIQLHGAGDNCQPSAFSDIAQEILARLRERQKI